MTGKALEGWQGGTRWITGFTEAMGLKSTNGPIQTTRGFLTPQSFVLAGCRLSGGEMDKVSRITVVTVPCGDRELREFGFPADGRASIVTSDDGKTQACPR